MFAVSVDIGIAEMMNSMPQRDPELDIALSNKLCKNSGCLIDSVRRVGDRAAF